MQAMRKVCELIFALSVPEFSVSVSPSQQRITQDGPLFPCGYISPPPALCISTSPFSREKWFGAHVSVIQKQKGFGHSLIRSCQNPQPLAAPSSDQTPLAGSAPVSGRSPKHRQESFKNLGQQSGTPSLLGPPASVPFV